MPLAPQVDSRSNGLGVSASFDALIRDPDSEVVGGFGGGSFRARIAIPHYARRIERQYRHILPDGLPAACRRADIDQPLSHFGLVMSFAAETEIALHDGDMVLESSIRDWVGRFGVVIMRRAHIAGAARERFHRNIFPHLRFHIDRGPGMADQYSCFTRDPSDPVQRMPRDSSTLFIAPIVAWLDMVDRGVCTPDAESGIRPSYDLFPGERMAALFDEIVLEQPWTEAEGMGEIAVIDNRTVLHATYHKDGATPGYPIGTRYLF